MSEILLCLIVSIPLFKFLPTYTCSQCWTLNRDSFFSIFIKCKKCGDIYMACPRNEQRIRDTQRMLKEIK